MGIYLPLLALYRGLKELGSFTSLCQSHGYRSAQAYLEAYLRILTYSVEMIKFHPNVIQATFSHFCISAY